MKKRAHLAARQTLHLVAELSLEALDDKAIVPAAVDVPLALAHDLLRERLEVVLPFGAHLDRRRFRDDVVEVLVQAVEEEAKELLRVVLLRAAELGRPSADVLAERDRREEQVVLRPDRPDQLGDGVCERAFGAERVDAVDVALVAALCSPRSGSAGAQEGQERKRTLEVPCERDCGAEALDGRVHVARVAEVLEPREPDRVVAKVDLGCEPRAVRVRGRVGAHRYAREGRVGPQRCRLDRRRARERDRLRDRRRWTTRRTRERRWAELRVVDRSAGRVRVRVGLLRGFREVVPLRRRRGQPARIVGRARRRR